MPPEIASSARALCQDTHCKGEGIKIPKGELRFGTWATFSEDRGSWKWKHWYACCPSPIGNTGADHLVPTGDVSLDFKCNRPTSSVIGKETGIWHSISSMGTTNLSMSGPLFAKTIPASEPLTRSPQHQESSRYSREDSPMCNSSTH